MDHSQKTSPSLSERAYGAVGVAVAGAASTLILIGAHGHSKSALLASGAAAAGVLLASWIGKQALEQGAAESAALEREVAQGAWMAGPAAAARDGMPAPMVLLAPRLGSRRAASAQSPSPAPTQPRPFD